jgi:multiple sugar transport system permease protein
VILILFPIYWTFISSVKAPDELITSNPTFYPHNWTWEYYDTTWNFNDAMRTKLQKEVSGSTTITAGIERAFFNSGIVTLGTIILSLIVCTFAGYALTFFRIPLKETIFILLILPILIPAISLIIPIYKLLKSLGLTDTHMGLIFLHSTAMLPIGVFMMRNAFSSIPSSLREVAMLEGTSELRIMSTIMIPLAIPGLLTVMVFALYISWNDYILAFIYINSPDNIMLNTTLAKIALGGAKFEMKWGNLTAGSIMSFIPIIIIYSILQRYFIRGITGSAVKE